MAGEGQAACPLTTLDVTMALRRSAPGELDALRAMPKERRDEALDRMRRAWWAATERTMRWAGR